MTVKRSVWSRNFFPVLITFFIDNFGMAIVYPIFTPFFLRPKLHMLGTDLAFGERTFLLSLLIATFPIAQAFGAAVIGSLSDRFGRKTVYLYSITGGAIGYILTGFGIHLELLSLLWIGRTIAGLFAGNLALCLAATADISTTKEERTRNFGWIGTLAGISFILAILTGSSLSNPDLALYFHPEFPFFVTGGLALVNLILMIIFFKESRETEPHDTFAIFKSLKTIGYAITQKGIRTIYFSYFLFMVCWVTSIQFLSANLIADFNVQTNAVTLTFVFVGLTWAVANFILNPILSQLLAAKKTFTIALTGLSLFLFLTLIPHEPLPIWLIHFFLATLFAALAWTNGLATLSLVSSHDTQGSILGINQSIIAIASIAGPITGGFIASLDIHKLYLFTATCSFVAALATSLTLINQKR